MQKIWFSAHFFASLAFAFMLIFFQGYVLASSSAAWWHWDLLAIYVFYVGLEHHTVNAALKIALSSLLFEVVSAVPAGFSLMAHFVMMLLGNRIAFWLEMRKRGMQLLLFGFLLASKEVMLAATLSAMGVKPDFAYFASARLPGVVMTLILAIPLMEALAALDGFFERRESLSRIITSRGGRI